MASLFHDMGDKTEKMHSPVRTLIVKQKDMGAAKRTTGLIDPGLFQGTNNIHAIMDGTGLWGFKYDKGVLPEPLRQRFTSINKAINFAKEYLGKRNVDVIEVKDTYEQKSWNSSTE